MLLLTWVRLSFWSGTYNWLIVNWLPVLPALVVD